METDEVKNKVEKAIKNVEHPEINSTLFELGMIKDISAGENEVSLTLNAPFAGIPIKDMLIEDIKKALKDAVKDISVTVNVKEMDDDERERFMKMAQNAWKG
ncbi:MAG: hypothetical protein B1H08_00685 [Candidatus Omnitrophica bacterium 4484_171]|nr:MAG: hypothetical protein B1H08_00685 [Candidatus Omnitrophica bacterium 4484_171]